MPYCQYTGPQTTFNLPSEKEGGDPTSLVVPTGTQLEIPTTTLGLPYFARLQRKGWLKILSAAPATFKRRGTRKSSSAASSPSAEEAAS